MTLRCRSLGALAVALGLLVAGCGESARAPEPRATAKPKQQGTVTAAEQRVIRRWADELRHGNVRAAAQQFSVPAEIVNMQPDVLELDSARRVEDFNDSLPCGVRVIDVKRTVGKLVVGEFELTSRPGADCGTNTGTRATFAFLIDADEHIARFIYIGEGDPPGADSTLT